MKLHPYGGFVEGGSLEKTNRESCAFLGHGGKDDPSFKQMHFLRSWLNDEPGGHKHEKKDLYCVSLHGGYVKPKMTIPITKARITITITTLRICTRLEYAVQSGAFNVFGVGMTVAFLLIRVNYFQDFLFSSSFFL